MSLIAHRVVRLLLYPNRSLSRDVFVYLSVPSSRNLRGNLP